ncbi:hypothetical protein TNCV_2545741 [Trichonephila clavipes]|nr:hypothetical protein TNCV_2545741 [Trichonephila clavipes]
MKLHQVQHPYGDIRCKDVLRHGPTGSSGKASTRLRRLRCILHLFVIRHTTITARLARTMPKRAAIVAVVQTVHAAPYVIA